MDRGFSPSTPKPRLLRGLTRGMAALFFLGGMISGCGKPVAGSALSVNSTEKSSQQLVGQKTNRDWLASCPSCSLIRQPITLLRHVHSTTNDRALLMTFGLVIDASDSNFNFSDARVASQYFGRATLLGRWRITQVSDRQLCGAPVGEYVVRPLTPSYLTSGAISGGTFEAIGPVRVVFRLQGSVFMNIDDAGAENAAQTSASSSSNRMNFSAMIDSVNNSPCGVSLVGN